VAYTVALKDGRVLVGIVRTEGADSIRVTDTDAKTTVIHRAEIEEFRPSATSIMPVGLMGTLGEGPLRDLLSFLTQPPAGAASP
jgi:putative heme-binding domain-containing protein